MYKKTKEVLWWILIISVLIQFPIACHNLYSWYSDAKPASVEQFRECLEIAHKFRGEGVDSGSYLHATMANHCRVIKNNSITIEPRFPFTVADYKRFMIDKHQIEQLECAKKFLEDKYTKDILNVPT